MTLASASSRPSWSLFLFILILLGCALPRVKGHIQLSDPVPINAPKNPHTTWETADYDYTSPLHPSGSNFPCKGYHLTTPQPIASYKAGDTYTATLAGSATHTGGSCQFALSYDKGQSFKVIKSIIGGCPVKQAYEFTIPAEAPRGEDVLFAWTWVNREGNREFYMDCAWVSIEGSEEGSLNDLPDIYVANVESVNGCATREREDVVFEPEIRGPETEFGGGVDEGAQANVGEECTWHGERSEEGAVASQSYKAASKADVDHADMDHADEGMEHDNGDMEDHDHDHDHEGMPERGNPRAGLFAPGAARGPGRHNHDDYEPPASRAVLGVLANPSASSRSQGRPGGQPRPIAIGEPHPIALAGYDLYYDHDYVPASPPPPAGDEDTTVTVDVTEACPTDDAVYVTVTASCTSLPDVTVTMIASTVTVRASRTSSSAKKTMTYRRSTLYSVISGPPPTSRPTPNSSWRTSARSPSPQSSSAGGGGGEGPSNDLEYATDPAKYLPCTPGAFLCTSATSFLTCDQWGDGNAHGWTWLYPRQVAAGMVCKPNLVNGRRGDLYVREGS